MFDNEVENNFSRGINLERIPPDIIHTLKDHGVLADESVFKQIDISSVSTYNDKSNKLFCSFLKNGGEGVILNSDYTYKERISAFFEYAKFIGIWPIILVVPERHIASSIKFLASIRSANQRINLLNFSNKLPKSINNMKGFCKSKTPQKADIYIADEFYTSLPKCKTAYVEYVNYRGGLITDRSNMRVIIDSFVENSLVRDIFSEYNSLNLLPDAVIKEMYMFSGEVFDPSLIPKKERLNKIFEIMKEYDLIIK